MGLPSRKTPLLNMRWFEIAAEGTCYGWTWMRLNPRTDVGGLSVATPLQQNPQLISWLRRLQGVPPWALLSFGDKRPHVYHRAGSPAAIEPCQRPGFVSGQCLCF